MYLDRLIQPSRDGSLFRRVHDTEQIMRNAVHVGFAGTIRDHLETGIELQAVGIDDRAPKALAMAIANPVFEAVGP